MEIRYISSLTGVRAIAAYMVFLHHYASSNYQENFLSKIFLEFHTGVSIFFVLSGFLIAYRYYDTAVIDYKWFKKYLISRFSRIYPLLIVVTVITLIFTQNDSIKDWFLSLTLLKGFLPGERFIVISQTWSLSVEIMFYILAPFIFIISKKKGSLILQLLLILSIGLFISTYNKNFSLENITSGNLFILLYTFLGRAFEFFVGIYLALFLFKENFLKNFLLNKKNISWTLVGLILFTLTILVLVFLQSDEYRFGAFSPYGVIIHNFFLPITIAIFFLGLTTESTILSKILSSRFFDILGKSSYAFYLIHLGIFPKFLPVFFQLNTVMLFIGLNILALILYYLVERPLNSLLRRIS